MFINLARVSRQLIICRLAAISGRPAKQLGFAVDSRAKREKVVSASGRVSLAHCAPMCDWWVHVKAAGEIEAESEQAREAKRFRSISFLCIDCCFLLASDSNWAALHSSWCVCGRQARSAVQNGKLVVTTGSP